MKNAAITGTRSVHYHVVYIVMYALQEMGLAHRVVPMLENAGAMLSQVRYRFHGRRSAFARCGTDFAAGAALSQDAVQISWQAQYFRKVRYRFRIRRSTLARSGTDFVARAALSQGRRNAFAGQVQISRQAQRFRKVRYRFRGRRSTFARCGPDFVAGTRLSEGQVQISQQAQHFSKVRDRFAAGCKVRSRFRGRRSTFARGTNVAASQGAVQSLTQAQH